MDEVDITARALTALSVILALYAVVHVVLFVVSSEPVYLYLAVAGAVASAVTAYVRRRALRRNRRETGYWIPGPTVLGPGESWTVPVKTDDGDR